MVTWRGGLAAVGLMLAAAALLGCSRAAPPAPPAASPRAFPEGSAPAAAGTAAPQTLRPRGDQRRHRSGTRGADDQGASAAAKVGTALPADWPALPLPPGTLIGATGAGGSWTVQLRAEGSADDVRRSTESFFAARGFTSTGTTDVLVRGRLRLVVVAENRDHSPTATTLVLGLTRG